MQFVVSVKIAHPDFPEGVRSTELHDVVVSLDDAVLSEPGIVIFTSALGAALDKIRYGN